MCLFSSSFERDVFIVYKFSNDETAKGGTELPLSLTIIRRSEIRMISTPHPHPKQKQKQKDIRKAINSKHLIPYHGRSNKVLHLFCHIHGKCHHHAGAKMRRAC